MRDPGKRIEAIDQAFVGPGTAAVFTFLLDLDLVPQPQGIIDFLGGAGDFDLYGHSGSAT